MLIIWGQSSCLVLCPVAVRAVMRGAHPLLCLLSRFMMPHLRYSWPWQPHWSVMLPGVRRLEGGDLVVLPMACWLPHFSLPPAAVDNSMQTCAQMTSGLEVCLVWHFAVHRQSWLSLPAVGSSFGVRVFRNGNKPDWGQNRDQRVEFLSV